MNNHRNERHLDSTIKDRQMRVERQINFVRIALIAVGIGLDTFTAMSQHLVSSEYVAFDVAVVILAAVYMGTVHLFSNGKKYHGWLKYLTVTVDIAIMAAFFAEMRQPSMIDKVNPETIIAATSVFVIIIVMLNAVRLSRPAVVYSGILGTILVLYMALFFSRDAIARIWLPASIVVAGSITYWISGNIRRIARDLSRRERLARFLPRELVKIVEGSDLEVTLGGKAQRVTVLFADIRNFTRFSENREPQEVVDMLNEYFTLMSGAIHRNGGMIDKYIGDAVMAVFGAPLSKVDDASRAVGAAGEMIQDLKLLNERWRRAGREPITIGIALHTGVAVAGNIGAPDRMDYTVIGDTVNLTARLEELNKKYGTHFLMSEDTYREVSRDFEADFVAETDIRGRMHPVKIYTLRDSG